MASEHHQSAPDRRGRSLFRVFPRLPKHRAMSLSPWLIVGSALILGLAIVFWAVKNTSQQRETMTRALLERAGALMWAMEGGARAGMGLQRTAFYLQYMLEETARQQGIVYMAVVSADGTIVAHSDRSRVDGKLLVEEEMAPMPPDGQIAWRILDEQGRGRIFEARRLFVPLPGFEGHGGHGHMRHNGMMSRRKARTGQPPLNDEKLGPPPPLPPTMDRQPGIFGSPPPLRQPGERAARRFGPGQSGARSLGIVVGLDMELFDKALESAETNTLFWALLVGLLGIGGFISLFWAQNYRLSRRMLMDATAFSSEVISSLPLGLVIFDSDGRLTHVNGVAEKLLGRPFSELRGLEPGRIHGKDWAGIAGRIERGEQVLEEEHTLAPQGGEASVPVSVSASRMANERGQDLGMIFLLRDLREVKGLQAELRRSERLSTLGNMAARVAHEIRNPLSSIKGFATYLARRHDNDDDREAARTMIGEVERLNRVVSELLDFARPSDSRLEKCMVRELLERALRLAQTDAEARGVNLGLESAAADALSVMADGERITQALLNLLLNAIQATEAGGQVLLVAGQPEGGRLAITVKDTGKGITPEVREKMFSPYFTTRVKGTGLGLSIVSRIIEEHHGEIAVRSEPGRGSAITVWLPLPSGGPEEKESGGPNPPGSTA